VYILSLRFVKYLVRSTVHHPRKGDLMHRYIFVLSICCLIAVVFAAGQTGQRGYFVTKLGRDTIAVEEFTADAHNLRGTAVARANRTTVREYSASFDAAGNLQNFHIVSRLYDGTTISDREYLYTDDSVRVTMKQDTAVTRFTIATQGRPVPLFIDLFGGWQLALRQALGANKKQFGVAGGRRVMHYTIDGTSPGELKLVNAEGDFGPLRVIVGDGGQLEKFDMTATTDKFIAERVDFADVKALAKEFTEREKAGSALGVLSPRDTVRAEVRGARLVVDYGRPAVRGRTIFGNVVPWDSVWRTGANAATQLTTDKELLFGAIAVPPGTYTLFTIPGAERWQLIINRQHGQWGTDYDVSKDLTRLPMESRHRDDLIERFTISIATAGTDGVLHLAWEHTELTIPFTVR
jgi:hypothetical protein